MWKGIVVNSDQRITFVLFAVYSHSKSLINFPIIIIIIIKLTKLVRFLSSFPHFGVEKREVTSIPAFRTPKLN